MNDTGDSGGDTAAAPPAKPFSFGAVALDSAGGGGDEPHERVLALPDAVKRRVRGLRKLQEDCVRVEAQFYRKVHELECEFAQRFADINAKRDELVSGKREPTEDEAAYPLFNQLMNEMINTMKETKLTNGDAKGAPAAGGDAPPPYSEVETGGGGQPQQQCAAGVPDFWLTVLKGCSETAEMIQEHDEAILKHITNIDCFMTKEPMKFRLEFHFASNDYFGNAVLGKEYTLTCDPDDKDPFSFDGPEVNGCTGCTIDWKPGKNVTVKLVKKKQKHREKQQTRYVTKQVKADSFFNFFDPPRPDDGQQLEDMDEEAQAVLEADYELGLLLRDRLVPRATMYYTGEADDNDYDDEEMDEDEEESDEDDDDQ